MNNYRQKLAEAELRRRRDNLRIFLYAVVGLLISVASFVLHHYFGQMIAVTVLICIADVIYAFLNARIFLTSRNWRGVKYLFILLMMIVYWALLFGVVCVFNALVLKGPFSYHFYLYPVFLMPAFVIEILLVGLILEYL